VLFRSNEISCCQRKPVGKQTGKPHHQNRRRLQIGTNRSGHDREGCYSSPGRPVSPIAEIAAWQRSRVVCANTLGRLPMLHVVLHHCLTLVAGGRPCSGGEARVTQPQAEQDRDDRRRVILAAPFEDSQHLSFRVGW